jgi:hypothetical protein
VIRKPDISIGGEDNPYLERWYVIPRNRWFNIYLHRFLRSDDDRALHDHPWVNLSILLRGRYTEHLPSGVLRVRWAGNLVARRPTALHRVELTHGTCWTLFLTGPRVREWGFQCPQGWRHWKDFTAGDRGELVGRGCE